MNLLFYSLAQAVFEDRLKSLPIALPQMCCALDVYASPSERQVVIAGARSDERALALLQAAHSVYEPDRAVSARTSVYSFARERNVTVASHS